MMGSENQGEAHLQAPRVASMETLTLDDEEDLTSKSYASYVSAMTTLSNSQHPLLPSIVATPADADPLLFPAQPLSPLGASNSPRKTYLEPPSYADAVFNPLDQHASSGEEANGRQSPVGDSDKSVMFPRSPSSSSEYLKVAVSNPQKEMESSNSIVPGGNTFVTYLITTKTNIPDYGGSEFSVRRRFKDVVALADRLNEAYRGYFIPPRPDKSVVESQVMQKQEFVEQRSVALERYLKRLVAHPVIKKSNELRAFLQVQGKLPLQMSTDVASRVLDEAAKLPKQFFQDSRNAVQPQDVAQPARGGRDLLRLFRELKQSVVNDWSGSRPLVEEDDKEFLEKKERLRELEQQLTTASKQAELLVKEQQDMAETMGQLGLVFLKLTKFENERAVLNTQKERAADMKNVATAAVKASRLYRELNAQTVKHLDVLHEHLGLMLAVHGAFSDRSSALLTVQTLLSELSALNSKAEKLETSPKKFGGDGSKILKLDELNGAIRATEDAKSCAIREYERIKEINRIEIGRLDRERHEDFINMLKGFVISQAAYSEKIGKEWTKVAEETSRYTQDSA